MLAVFRVIILKGAKTPKTLKTPIRLIVKGIPGSARGRLNYYFIYHTMSSWSWVFILEIPDIITTTKTRMMRTFKEELTSQLSERDLVEEIIRCIAHQVPHPDHPQHDRYCLKAFLSISLDDLRSVSPTQHSTSAHDTSLVTALDAADKMGYKIPRDFIIYAVEVENILEFNETPTPAVAKAISVVTSEIITKLSLKIR